MFAEDEPIPLQVAWELGGLGGSNSRRLAVLPDGRLASGDGDGTIELRDPASSKQGSSQLLFVADAAITALAFLPNASLLVADDASGRLHWLRLPGP